MSLPFDSLPPDARFLAEHLRLTRRHWLAAGVSATTFGLVTRLLGGEPARAADDQPKAQADSPADGVAVSATPLPPELSAAIAQLEPFFTAQSAFRDVSRGKPIPHSLDEEKRKAVGLTRDTWKLEVVSDSEQPATVRKPMSKADNTALDFAALMELAKTKAVRYAKVMTCLNIGCPLGMGVWEGVPLRDVLWLAQPKENLRRVFYYGFHNDDPAQMFRSSLPVGRILEDYFDLPPVILCYKLNGDWLTPQRGGPVRVVVPEAYGFKSIKWLQRIVLSNIPHANDTYANGNNDLDSPLKSFAATLLAPKEHSAGKPLALTGYAQVGISGVSKVQVWLHKGDAEWPGDDPYFERAPWVDARLLGPPPSWGGDLPDGKIPASTRGFDPTTGRPTTWPLPLGKVHWAALLPAPEPGEYTLRCRTVDSRGVAQPLPRPFRKSGHAAVEQVAITVK